MAAVIIHSDFGAQENKICLTSTFSLSICHEVMGLNAKILVLFSFFFFNIEIILLLVTKKKKEEDSNFCIYLLYENKVSRFNMSWLIHFSNFYVMESFPCYTCIYSLVFSHELMYIWKFEEFFY